jgi:hypothetical protein
VIGGYGVVLFHTTSAAMRAERTLRAERLEHRLIPTPREFSSDCGIALRFDWTDADRVATMIDEAHVEIAGIHRMEIDE